MVIILTVLKSIWSFITSKLGLALMLAAAVAGMWLLGKSLRASEAETSLKDQDLKNVNFDMARTTAKNGQLEESVTSLQISSSDLKAMNQGVAAQVSALGIKLSQLQDVTNVIARQSFQVPVIQTTRDTSRADNAPADTGTWSRPAGVYGATWHDRWARFTADVNLQRGSNPFLTNVQASLSDSLIVAHETKRKRVWLFFHKVIGVTTHITSNSPYFRVDTVEDYRIEK